MMIDKRLLAMVPEAKRFIIGKTMSNWVSLLAGICLWFLAARLFENVLQSSLKPETAVFLFGGVAVCAAVRFALTRLSSSLTHRASSCVKTKLRGEVYEKLRRLGGRYSGAFATSEIVQLAGEGIEQLETYFGNYLPQFAYALLAPLTLLIVFLPLSPLTAVVLFVCVPLIPLAIVAVQRFAKKLLGKYWDAYANLGDSFLENLQGLTTLKVYGADERRHEEMNREAENFRVVTMKVLTMQLNSVTIMDFVAYGGTALGSIMCALSFAKGTVSFGNAIAMILLASEFFLAMRALGSYFHVAMNGVAASERLFRLLDLDEPEDGGEEARPGDILVRNLSFAYDWNPEGAATYSGAKQASSQNPADEESRRMALEGMNLSVSSGSFISVTGESGCGKSTLASLISGRLRNYQGSIVIGGRDGAGGTQLRDISEKSLRRLITVVSSDSYIFAGTVRDTLSEGNHNASESEMYDALRRVKLYDFVMEREGLDTEISERASNLSGGQRQRLALARALLRNSPVYIFDEATSNIDAESEMSIMQAIRSLKGSHTIILISHRLANVTDSDEIFFLRAGRLAEHGTHSELMAAGGGYAALFEAQNKLENIGNKEAAS